MSSPTIGGAEPEPFTPQAEPAARVVANSAWVLLAQGVATLIAGGVSIYAIRSFSTTSWGHYSTALALVAIFAIFSGGIAPLALREMTSALERQEEILGLTLEAVAAAFCAAIVALFVTAVVLGYSRDVLALIAILSVSLLFDPTLTNLGAALNARFRLAYLAFVQIAQSLIYGTLAVIVIATSLGVAGLAVSSVIGTISATALALVLLRVRFGVTPTLGQPSRRVVAFLRTATPIAGINVVSVVYAQVDVVLLSLLATSSRVAFYTVPYSFVRLSWLVPSVVSAAFFPLLRRRLGTAPAEARSLFFLVVRAFLFLSVPISMLLALSAPTVLPFVFGDPYTRSVAVLEIMAWTSVFGFLNYVLWYGVLAAGLERTVLYIMAAGLVANVAINLVLIPRYGPSGAALALVISDLVVVAGQVSLVHRKLFTVPFVDLLAKPAAAAIVTVPPAVLLAVRSPLAGAFAGALAYAGVLLLARYITLDEWRPVLAVLAAPFDRLKRAG